MRKKASYYCKASSALLLATMMLCASLPAPSMAASKEYLVKAAFIYRFTKFVKWPEEITTFNVCVKGENLFNGVLKKLEERSTASLSYQIYENPANLSGCHLIYYTPEATPASLHQVPALTVGEGEEFLEKGGVIGLVKKENRVKFSINLPEAKRRGLGINPQLLEIAEKVLR